MRQRDLGERRALAQLHDGRSDAYLDWATSQDRVIVHTDDNATNAAVADWKQAAAEHGPDQAVLIARDNATRASSTLRRASTSVSSGSWGRTSTTGR